MKRLYLISGLLSLVIHILLILSLNGIFYPSISKLNTTSKLDNIEVSIIKISPPKAPSDIIKNPSKQNLIVDKIESPNNEKPNKTSILSRGDSKAHSNLFKKRSDSYKDNKTVIPRLAASEPPTTTASPSSIIKENNETFMSQREKKDNENKRESSEENKTKSIFSKDALTHRNIPSFLDGADIEKVARMDTGDDEVSGDNTPISLDTKDYKYIDYFATIKRQIQIVWTYPPEAIKKGISGRLDILFTINRDGKLQDIQLVSSSGYKMLDEEAITAINVASPFQPIPEHIKGEKLPILGKFIYYPAFGPIAY